MWFSTWFWFYITTSIGSESCLNFIDLITTHYLFHSRNSILPLRWLPYEAVFDDEFSTKSDVYSFGMLMWEIFNKGELPFSELGDDQVLSQLESRKLCVKHSSRTPETITLLHQKCTESHPNQRMTFSDIVSQLREVMTAGKSGSSGNSSWMFIKQIYCTVQKVTCRSHDHTSLWPSTQLITGVLNQMRMG